MHVLQRRMKWHRMSLCKQRCHVAFSSPTDQMHCENGSKHLEETDGRNEREKRQINTTSSVWGTHSDHAKISLSSIQNAHMGQGIHKCTFQMRNKRQEVRQQNNLQHHKLSPTSLLLSSLKGEQNVSEMCFWILR